MTASAELPRVLFVDDEKRVLDGIRRHLRKDFDLSFAVGGSPALTEIEKNGPFEVVVSDLQMPGMDGVTLLSKVREQAPDTVRVLLTGNADLKSAILAVNEGCVYRFLTKPCPAEQLIVAVNAACDQHKLITAEKVLLEETLHGSIRVLTEILSLVQPDAFGRANRLKKSVGCLADALELPDRWRYEMAAMLSQIGAVTLSGETAAKIHRGEALEVAEQAQLDKLPEITEQLLRKIPRLDEVREMLRFQTRHFDGSGPPADACTGEDIPVGARMLRVALDADELEARGLEPGPAAEELASRKGWYDPTILAALERVHSADRSAELEVLEIGVDQLRAGLVFAQDCTAQDGRLLVARGQEVTTGVLERVRNFAENVGVTEPLQVYERVGAEDPIG